jgi:hypothetical protein
MPLPPNDTFPVARADSSVTFFHYTPIGVPQAQEAGGSEADVAAVHRFCPGGLRVFQKA